MKFDEVELESVDCPNGCMPNDQCVLSGHDRLHALQGKYTVMRCHSCGMMRTSPRPTPETIGYYYPENYGPYIGTQIDRKTSRGKSRFKQLLRVIKRLFEFNTEKIPDIEPGYLLEVGCASGSFLHKMALDGWQTQGIEFSESAGQSAIENGLSVHIGSLETAPEMDKRFDLIVGWMVLEHLHDPVACLEKLQQYAKPEAWLVLSVPNTGSYEFKLFLQRWYALQLPTHLYHFSPKTLTQMLAITGWGVEKIHHQRILSNLIASVGYWLTDKGFESLGKTFVNFPEKPGHWHYYLYPLAWLLSLFGQTGRMTVWARLKNDG